MNSTRAANPHRACGDPRPAAEGICSLVRMACLLAVAIGLQGRLGADDGAELIRFSRTGVHMGVEFEVVLYARSEREAQAGSW